MGERIRQARLEAGMSQNQLCQGLVTRNMLSQIENGTAKPSLSTLEALAKRLSKPVCYFFGEEDLGDRAQVDRAWRAFRRGDALEAARILDGQKTAPRFEDVSLLKTLVLLDLAEKAIQEKRFLYAREMLTWIQEENWDLPEVKRRTLLLMGRLEGQQAEPVCSALASLDPELLLRARAALEQKNPDRAARLLDAAEDRKNPDWAMLRGRAYLMDGHFRKAARCFHQAEKAYPQETSPYLEQCYRELEDFKKAYFYACRQKQSQP